MIRFYDFLLTILTPFIILVGKFGLPSRKVTGYHYYKYRNAINPGTVLLSKTNFELSNLINPTQIKHAGIYIGNIDGVGYVLEAVGKGVRLIDLVSFMTSKDIVVGCKPTFIRNEEEFLTSLARFTRQVEGKPYDYLFKKGGKAFYCFELAAEALKYVYPELQLQCREILKGKKIYDENTFLDSDFFEIVFDSRELN